MNQPTMKKAWLKLSAGLPFKNKSHRAAMRCAFYEGAIAAMHIAYQGAKQRETLNNELWDYRDAARDDLGAAVELDLGAKKH